MIIFNHMVKFTTMNSLLEIQTTPSSATNTVNTGIIEALMEEEEDNEGEENDGDDEGDKSDDFDEENGCMDAVAAT